MASPKKSLSSRMARLCAAVACLSVLTLVGCAVGTQSPITSEIVDYGIERRHDERIIPDANVASGRLRLIKNFQFIERTTEIPAVLGTAFSMCVEVRGLQRDEWDELKHEVEHPVMTSPDGTTWRIQGGAARPVQGSGGSALTCVGYGLDQPFEVVAGQWTLSVKYAGKTVASKLFTLR